MFAEFRMPARALACVALASALSGQVLADEKPFFKGKTITWYVGTGAGGGHDYYARLLARHFPKHLPGTTVIIVNRPGAGHIIAANIIYASKPDGLSFGSISTGLAYSQIMKTEGIRFDLAKMSWIGKAADDVRMIVVAAKSEFKTFDDILNSKRIVKFSTSGIGGGAYIDSFLTAKAFDIPHKLIVGYSGGASVMGLMRGETDVLQGGAESGMEYVRAGHARPVLQFGTRLQGVPNAADYAKTPLQKALVTMLGESGKLARITAGPPGIPAPRLDLLRTAYMATATDPELLAQAAKSQNEVIPAHGEEVHKSILSILQQPPTILSMLNESSNASVEERKVVLVKATGSVAKVEANGGAIVITADGKEVPAKLSGSRTAVTIAGAKADRKAIAVGMTCTITSEEGGSEARNVDCK